ncbi:DUF6624 domain-containing protein [Lutimonas zeaxanthinifaciens]|uniref:DUF6624 domain-containing protein n=1 Tax=Lutimonas zeaxanthinifaciens TaxID=3060215 RepID=UPI00265D41BA|nr:DUF6624 domain-containing protein [Lutimonas sp. YSD2104]WKK65701.1 hypothetical protein QZH61_14060 [Lutimonas sp. YSD2104]
MKSIITFYLLIALIQVTSGQGILKEGDSLKDEGLLMPALMKYASTFVQTGSEEASYKIASTSALLWTTKMRDTAFYFLNYAVKKDSTLKPLYEPQFLSLIDDPRWEKIEKDQIRKYEAKNGPIQNEPFARELFKMIIKDQGFMYTGNIERRKYMQNGGYFSTPAIFPVLAMEEKNMQENQKRLFKLLDKYGWPTATEVTEYAAAGAALIINHSTYEVRLKYFPMLEEAFKKGEAQPLRYAKMRDRLLVEEGKKQLYGTQIKMENLVREPHPIEDPEQVDQRRAEIGLGPLAPYLKERFDIDWQVSP